jgi:hypothetical protein
MLIDLKTNGNTQARLIETQPLIALQLSAQSPEPIRLPGRWPLAAGIEFLLISVPDFSPT